MSYLLDTCILSKLRKKGTADALTLKTWIEKHDPKSYFISVLTVGELEFGIAKLKENEHIKNALRSWLIGELIPSFENRILPIDQQICSIWANMSAQAIQKGIVLPVSDALIASTAIKHDLIVVTQNTKHFSATGARIFDPLN